MARKQGEARGVLRMFSPIITERLLIRELVESDATQTYLGWLQDPEVNRFTEVRWERVTLDDLTTTIRHSGQATNEIFLGIFVRESTQHIGTIRISQISRVHRTAEIGFLIGERGFWGQGLATEAITRVSEFLMLELGLRKITAGCYAGNHGSARALLKSGFIHEATLRDQLFVDGGHVDELRFARFAANHAPGGFETPGNGK